MPRQVRPDFAAAAYPEWAPDGQHILFLGNRDEKQPAAESIDWWVTPLDQSPAIATGAFEAPRKVELTGPFLIYPWALIGPVWERRNDWLIFSARSGESTNLWRIGISPRTWKVQGALERLRSSPTIEERPSVASMPDGSVRVAVASFSENRDIWSLPVDATGKVTGEARQLTWDSTADFFASLSADRRKMVFVSARSGSQQVLIKDLATGEDTALTASPGDKWRPRFSPDALKVSFSTNLTGKWNIYIVPAAGGAAETICEDCGQVTSWSPDGRYLIGNDLVGRLFLVEVASHRRTDLLASRDRWFLAGSFSPDGRWITFGDWRLPRQQHIAPFQGDTMAPENAWYSMLAEDSTAWSADGTLVRGFSDQDGFNCIWGQRVDSATKRPVGAPFAIVHLHSLAALKASLSTRATDRLTPGSALPRDTIVFDLAERTGNIWMAQWKGW